MKAFTTTVPGHTNWSQKNKMKELFNEYVKSIETYIMFQIKQEAARLTPELEAKGRSPIALAMGAPVAPPPELVYQKLIEALKISPNLVVIPSLFCFFVNAHFSPSVLRQIFFLILSVTFS